MKYILTAILVSAMLSSCSDFENESEVLIDYKEDNGTFVKLSTGEKAVEEAAESFYHASNTLSEEDKAKELLLIDELGGFKAYYDFIDNADSMEISDMAEKYGLAPKSMEFLEKKN